MVVALHGMGGDENSMFDSYGKELPRDAQAHGFIVAAPKGREPASMYRGSAEQDVLDVMAEVERDYKVDRSRVYLMGHSMGGYGTWSIAMDHPDLFAALGPISGGGDASGMVKITAIPQYVTHGDDDRTVNVTQSRTMVEAGKKAGATITYNEVPGGSHVSVAQPAFAPMFDFFAKQVRNDKPSDSAFAVGGALPRPHNQHRDIQIVTHGVDGIAEDEVFQSAVAVRAHDDQVGTDFMRIADDLAFRGKASDLPRSPPRCPVRGRSRAMLSR